MPSVWQFDKKTKTYSNPDTGRVLSNDEMIALRDQWADSRKERVSDLAASLAEGGITVQQWEASMRYETKMAFITQYTMGKGGRGNMTYGDWGASGRMLRTQYEYLHGFAQSVSDGELTEAQIAARGSFYMDASVQAYERGRTATYGIPRLTQYPGDGQTSCRTSCKCALEITEDAVNWYVRWLLGPVKKEHCEDCARLSVQWNPLIIPKQ